MCVGVGDYGVCVCGCVRILSVDVRMFEDMVKCIFMHECMCLECACM